MTAPDDNDNDNTAPTLYTLVVALQQTVKQLNALPSADANTRRLARVLQSALASWYAAESARRCEDATPGDDYVQAVDRMREAARRWCAAHPSADLRFHDLFARFAREAGRPGEKIAVIGELYTVIDLWGATADARAFLTEIERAGTKGEKRPTVMMLEVACLRDLAAWDDAPGT